MQEFGLKESQIVTQRATSRVVDVYVEEDGHAKHVLHRDSVIVTDEQLVNALREHF